MTELILLDKALLDMFGFGLAYFLPWRELIPWDPLATAMTLENMRSFDVCSDQASTQVLSGGYLESRLLAKTTWDPFHRKWNNVQDAFRKARLWGGHCQSWSWWSSW